jgi:ABC-type lipoprotein release transport system permease subunit
MGGIGLLARVEVRSRWRSYLVIALLVGVVGGVVLTALAGARRTDSAFSRLRALTNESDASLEVSPEHFAAIEALPEVEAAAPGSFMFVMPADTELENLLTIAGTDERFGTVVNQPHLIEGRRPDPDRADEVLVTSLVADELGVALGDRLTLVSLTPAQKEQLIEGADPGAPAGPTIEIVVTGIGETAEDFANRSAIMLFTPAFYATHRDEVGHFDDILDVLLVDGEADMAAFRAGVERIVPVEEGAIIETKVETTAEIEDATSVQAVALVAFAIVVGLAGFVAVGQALARQIGRSSADQPGLRALGLPRRERSVSLLLPAVVVALAGAVLAVVFAVLASPMMPTGFARRVDPDPGLHADWLVLGLGFVAVALVVSARAAFTAWRTAGRLQDAPAGAGGARIVGRVARLGAPPPVVAGVRMALEPGRGRTAVPVRPAIAGAVAGVAGLIAALTFGAGLGWVVTEPEAYGWRWDTGVVGPRESEALVDSAAAFAEIRDIEGVAALSVLPIRLGGEPIQSYGLEAVKGGGFVTVLRGRMPTGADEVLVGERTLDRLDRDVGDSIDAEGLEGNDDRTVTIVGRGVFPEFVHPAVPDSDTGAYNEFALFSQAGGAAVIADAGEEFFSLMLIRWAPDVDVAAADAGLAEDGFELMPPTLPSNLENVERVDAVPMLVGAFLGLLAVVALANALVTSVRTRARDFALLETLGFVGAQIRATVASQASALAAIGLVLGIPAGLVLGRVAWTMVARGLGVESTLPVPWLAIVLVVPATLVVANIVAALPARRAVRTRPAVVLRSE